MHQRDEEEAANGQARVVKGGAAVQHAGGEAELLLILAPGGKGNVELRKGQEHVKGGEEDVGGLAPGGSLGSDEGGGCRIILVPWFRTSSISQFSSVRQEIERLLTVFKADGSRSTERVIISESVSVRHVEFRNVAQAWLESVVGNVGWTAGEMCIL